MINPEAMGWSSTAIIGTGISMRQQGRLWREAKQSDKHEVVAPESIITQVVIGERPGMVIRTETKKCCGENRVVEVANTNAGGERGNSGMYDPSFAWMSWGLGAGVESESCVPASTKGPGMGGPLVRLFPTLLM